MRLCKLLLLFVAVMFCWVHSAEAASVSCTPNPTTVGTEVICNYGPGATPFDIRWNWGDGSPEDATGAGTTKHHVYRDVGSHTLRVEDTIYPGSQATETITVNKATAPKGIKRIDHRPAVPKVGQQFTLTAVNFDSTSCITWQFKKRGRRYPDRNPPEFVHALDKPGRYLVRAYDNCDTSSTPVTKYITIGRDTRTTTWLPVQPKAGQRVTFRSRGNYDSCKRVDFGDGTVQTIRTPIFTHTYRRPGTYRLTVYGYCGDDLAPQVYTITVVKGFTIDYLELRYKDTAPGAGTAVPKRFMGLAPNVEKGTRNFKAKAFIRYSGSGVITMQWLVKNTVIQMITKQVAGFHKQVEIDSVVDLPTFNLGRHDVTVRFISPRGTALRMPALKYFVTQPKPEATDDGDGNLSVLSTGVINGPGQQTPINESVQLPSGKHSLLGGEVFNRGGRAFTGRLNIYLDGTLVDSQVILDLGGGDPKMFDVSFEMGGDQMTLDLVLINQDGETVDKKQYTVEPSP